MAAAISLCTWLSTLATEPTCRNAAFSLVEYAIYAKYMCLPLASGLIRGNREKEKRRGKKEKEGNSCAAPFAPTAF